MYRVPFADFPVAPAGVQNAPGETVGMVDSRVALGVGVGEGVGVGAGAGDADTVATGVGAADVDAVTAGVGEGVGVAVGDGDGAETTLFASVSYPTRTSAETLVMLQEVK